jgi:GNAT superfamily N-acetyltransferase
VAQYAGMFLELSELDENLASPSGLEIKTIFEARKLRAWVSILVVGAFNRTAEEGDAFFEIMKPLLDCPEARFYLGFDDGMLVTTSMSFLSDEMVSVFFVVTLPEYRRKGYGTELTLAVLQDGVRMGYQTSVLQATSMGEPVYRRIGFKSDGFIQIFRLRS